MSDFRGYNSSRDPARNKASLFGTPAYDASVAQFNNWLYTPMDRRPSPTGYNVSAQTRAASAPGEHAPSAPVVPGNYVTPYGTASVSNPSFPAYGGAPMAGAAGPSGPKGTMPSGNIDGPQTPFTSAVDTAPKATYSGVPTPPQNAMQRWQQPQAGGMKPLSDQRRYFWATGSIDAHATQADPNRNKGAVAPVTFVNSPSNWEPYQ